MKFRMFTDLDGHKIAISVDDVAWVEDEGKARILYFRTAGLVHVSEDFDTVFSRLNTIAE